MQFGNEFRHGDNLPAEGGLASRVPVDSCPELLNLLQMFPDDCQPRTVEFLDGAGGFSGATFWRLATDRGMLCLRCWPKQADLQWPARLQFIHEVLAIVSRRGTPSVPAPIGTQLGETFFQHAGRLWELTPWLAGAADYFPLRRAEKLRAACAALGEFHQAAAEYCGEKIHCGADLNAELAELSLLRQSPAPSPGIRQRFERIHALRAGQLQQIVSAVEAGSRPPTAADGDAWQVLRQLARRLVPLYQEAEAIVSRQLAAVADRQMPMQPCIRDIWHDHVLFDADRVSGIVDFGAMRIDNVACDIARLLGSMARDDAAAWHDGLAAYENIRPLAEGERTMIGVFDRSTTLLAGMNWLEWLFVDGRVFSDLPAVAERVAGIVERLEKVAGGQ